MGSSAKTKKNFFQGSPEHFFDKNAIWYRTPPPTHQLQSTCVGEGSRVPNLQTEFNYLDLFKSYGIFSDFLVPTWSPSSPRHPCHTHIVSTSSPSSPSSSCCPHSPQKIPMVCGLHMLSLSTSMSFPSSPHRLEGPHIIPNPPDTHSTHPSAPWGGGGLKSVKMQ